MCVKPYTQLCAEVLKLSKICSCMHKNNFRFQTFSDNLFAQKLFPPVSSLVCVIWSNNYDYSLLHTSSFSCQSQDVHCLLVCCLLSEHASQRRPSCVQWEQLWKPRRKRKREEGQGEGKEGQHTKEGKSHQIRSQVSR